MTTPSLPVPARWTTALPGNVDLPPVAVGDDLWVVAGDTLVRLDAATGAERERVVVGASASREVLVVAGDRVIVDLRRGREPTTHAVVVRAGAIERTIDLDCILGGGGAASSGGELIVLGVAGARGPVLRAFDPATGRRRLDHRVVPDGRDVIALDDRLLIVNSTGEPGLISVDRDGGDARTLEATPVQDAKLAAGRVLVAARTGEYPIREARLRDLATGALRWQAPAHGALIALDAETALHVDPEGDGRVLVARDAATGAAQWRGAALAAESGQLRLLGAVVAFAYGYGIQLFGRADGALLGEIDDGRMAASVGGAAYVAGRRWIARLA